MVSVQDSHSKPNITTTYPQTRSNYYYTPPPSSATINRPTGRSMRTIRSKIFHTPPLTDTNPNESDHLTDSFVDFQLGELANKSSSGNSKNLSSSDFDEILDVSHAFSDFSTDISGELHFLASVSGPEPNHFSLSGPGPEPEPEPCSWFLQRESFSTEIIDSISPEDLQPTVKLCVDGLNSSSVAVKRSAAAKLRLLGKNRADNRALIGECGAVPALVPLLCCSDSFTQEHAVTALLNLSLHERNKSLIMDAGAVKSIVYVLKTGTEVSKQNAACALLSLALMDDNKWSIGACGAIKPLVALLINGSDRGKKDALTTLYKLCTVRLNKERAVGAGAVRPLVGLVGEQGSGLAEKAIVVLSSLAGIGMGRDAIVEEGGIAALVEVIEDGSDKGKEFAVLTLMQLCGECVRNRGLLVSDGGIPLLVALSQTGTAKSKHKAEALLVHLRESREEAYSSIS